MRLSMQGLTIDWLPVEPASPLASAAPCTTWSTRTRRRPPSSPSSATTPPSPSPPSTFTLQAGDTAVVVGTPDGVEALSRLLQST